MIHATLVMDLGCRMMLFCYTSKISNHKREKVALDLLRCQAFDGCLCRHGHERREHRDAIYLVITEHTWSHQYMKRFTHAQGAS